MAENIITKELLHEILEYKEGKLFWKKITNPKIRSKVGEEAGTLTSHGYRRIVINYKQYFGHQLVFMMFHGYIPKEIDHINRIRNDNRIENLRPCTRSENVLNSSLSNRSTTKFKHIHVVKGYGYKVVIPKDGKQTYIGFAKTIDEAIKILKKASEK